MPPHPSASSQTAAPSSRDVAVAVVLMVTSMLLLVVMDTVAKWLSATLDPLFVTWGRYGTQLLLLVLIFRHHFPRLLRTQHLKLQLLRSVLMLGATLFFFTGLKYLPLSAAMALVFVSPLFVVAMAGPVLGEAVGLRRWIAVGVGLAGMLLVVRPGSAAFDWAALLVLGAALCYGSQQLATRHVATGDPTATTLIFTALFGGIVMSGAAPFVWTTPSWTEAAGLVSLGLLATAGHFLLIRALMLAPASLLAPLDYTSLVWATVLGVIVFGEVLDPLTLAGAAIIAGAGLFIYWRERQAARRAVPDSAALPPAA